MSETRDDPERIIAAAIERHAKGDPEALARAIVNELWEAGYDIGLHWASRRDPDAA